MSDVPFYCIASAHVNFEQKERKVLPPKCGDNLMAFNVPEDVEQLPRYAFSCIERMEDRWKNGRRLQIVVEVAVARE
jgi:hypothetical protein